MPEFMRISLNSLSSLFPIDIGEFAFRNRRILVIDRNTIAELKNMREGYWTGSKQAGFLYGYSYEDNLIAGHYKEAHESGILWWYKSWQTHHFLPKIKIGKTSRIDFQDRVLEQFTGPRIGVGHPEKAILLFLIYSPRVSNDPLNIKNKGLESIVHAELRKRGCFLRDNNRFEDTSPGTEWFEVNVGEAFAISTDFNKRIYEECSAYEISEAIE